MKRPAKQALINYFKGVISADEKEAVEAYLAMDTDTAYIEQCLREAMDSTDDNIVLLSKDQREQAWQKFDNRKIDEAIKLQPKHRRNWIAYAAAITVFIVSATFAFYLRQSTGARKSTVVYNRIEAGYGKIDHVTLPDSTQLSLFPGTIVDIPSDYNSRNRKVYLIGRAYFEVTHNKRKPFYVLTSKVTTRVLGTSFEVNAAKKENTASLILRTGLVCINNKDKQLAILHPGQKLTFHQATGKFLTEQVQPDKLLSWVTGELTFEQTSFAEMCVVLEKWYHITINVQNKQLLKKKITVSFKGQSSTQVLDVLSATAGFNYKAKNNIIHIY